MLVIDSSQKMCVYNTKAKNKCGRISIDYDEHIFQIKHFNKLLFPFNSGIFSIYINLIHIEYIVLIANYDESPRKEQTLLDFIKFQKQPNKPILDEFINIDLFNFNQNAQVNKHNSILLYIKIKDLMVKCYPQLGLIYKKGLSVRKVLEKHDINNLPSYDTQKEDKNRRHSFELNENNLKLDLNRRNLKKFESTFNTKKKMKQKPLAHIKENEENENDKKNEIEMDENLYDNIE